MRSYNYETQGTSTFIVYKLGQDEILDTVSRGMLSNNKIDSLLPMVFTQSDNDVLFKYNVTGKITVKQVLSSTVNKKQLLGILSGVADAVTAVDEYMLDPLELVLDTEYMFIDVSSCCTMLMCIPVLPEESLNKTVDFHSFIKNIVVNCSINQSENIEYFAKLISYLNTGNVLNTTEFRAFLKSLSSKPASQVPQGNQTRIQNVNAGITSSRNINSSVQRHPVPNQVTEKNTNYVQPYVSKETANSPQKSDGLQGSSSDSDSGKKNKQKKLHNSHNKVDVPQQVNIPVPSGSSFAIPGQSQTAVSPSQMQVKPSVLSNKPYTAMNANQSSENAKPNDQQSQMSLGRPVTPIDTQKANFGSTTVLDNNVTSGGTTILASDSAPSVQFKPYLIRKRNNEQIVISSSPFKLGREASYADYVIQNPYVGSSHADIIIQNDALYIVDNNSRNHTFVNGIQIQSKERVPINHGDVIKLADEEFEIRTK